MRRIGLILLAAGGSTRMKTPKQLLRWGNRTLLEHAAQTALKTSCRPIIVVLGCEAESCRKVLNSLPVITIINESWQKGMGTSIAAGIAALESIEPEISGAMLMLIDQPLMTSEFLDSLLIHWSPPHFAIAATAYGDKGGVPALFARTFFPELRELDSDRGARDIIAREIHHTALVLPHGTHVDLDTSEDYRTGLSDIGGEVV